MHTISNHAHWNTMLNHFDQQPDCVFFLFTNNDSIYILLTTFSVIIISLGLKMHHKMCIIFYNHDIQNTNDNGQAPFKCFMSIFFNKLDLIHIDPSLSIYQFMLVTSLAVFQLLHRKKVWIHQPGFYLQNVLLEWIATNYTKYCHHFKK